MTISALPTAPNRNMTPEAFVAAADAWVAAMNTFASQVNADLNLILNLSGLLATSTTSVAIGTGSKSFTVETSKAYLAGQSVRVYSTASPANYMLGTVTSYDAGTGALVVNVTSVGGSGTLAAWTVVLAASGEWLGNATTAGNLTGSPTFFAPITNSLAADVALNNTANFFTGPSVAQGTSGTWFASGTVTLLDTGGSTDYTVKLWDGTTVIASTSVNGSTGSHAETVSLSGKITNPAGNIRISVQDVTRTTGAIKANWTGVGNTDSTLTAFRIG